MFLKFGQLIMALSILLGVGTQNLALAQSRTELLERYRKEVVALAELEQSLVNAKEENESLRVGLSMNSVLTLTFGFAFFRFLLYQTKSWPMSERMPVLAVTGLVTAGSGVSNSIAYTEFIITKKNAERLKVELDSRKQELQLIENALEKAPK